MVLVFPLLNTPLSKYTEPYKLQTRGKAQHLRLVIPPILGLRKSWKWSKWIEINSIRSLCPFSLTLGKRIYLKQSKYVILYRTKWFFTVKNSYSSLVEDILMTSVAALMSLSPASCMNAPSIRYPHVSSLLGYVDKCFSCFDKVGSTFCDSSYQIMCNPKSTHY